MQGCVCPHPPILIPEIGRASRQAIAATVASMERLADALGDGRTMIIISPHTPGYVDAYTVKTAPTLQGDFGDFARSEVGCEIANDLEFAGALLAAANEEGTLAVQPDPSVWLDHGVMVPMHFLRASSLVSLSVVSAYESHRALGQLVRRCAEDLGRDVVFVASADLSHRLTPSAPAGYDPHGSAFDRRVVELLSEGDFAGLALLDDKLVKAAGQCGLRSLIALGGFLGDEAARNPRLQLRGSLRCRLSRWPPSGRGTPRDGRRLDGGGARAMPGRRTRRLRAALRRGVASAAPAPAAARRRALRLTRSLLLSIKKLGELRGCIGTLDASRAVLGREIARNAPTRPPSMTRVFTPMARTSSGRSPTRSMCSAPASPSRPRSSTPRATA